MTEEQFENMTKMILIVFSSLAILFFVSFVVSYSFVINPDAVRTFMDKTGWTINKGIFHKQVNCWGETIYYIGDEQIQYNQSWITKVAASTDSKIVYVKNLQEGAVYSTYYKHYSFLFVPANFDIIESEDCEN